VNLADPMRPVLSTIDRLAGRVYTRVLALILGAIGTAFVLTGVVLLWRSGGHLFGHVWLGGGVLFAIVARRCWRSRAALSDIDQSG
jgi:hypothetical protein